MSAGRTHSSGRDCRRALQRSAATRAFSMAAPSSQATQETCSESKTLMGRLSVGQASMETNFWRLPACTAISEAQLDARYLRAKSHRNATADRVDLAVSYMKGALARSPGHGADGYSEC